MVYISILWGFGVLGEVTSKEVEKRALKNFAVLASKLTELESLYHGSGAAPARAQSAPAAAPVDPMAGGNDSWSRSFLGGGQPAGQAPPFPSAAFGAPTTVGADIHASDA